MKSFISVVLLMFLAGQLIGQNCTISGTVNLNDLDRTSCDGPNAAFTPTTLVGIDSVIITGTLTTDGSNQTAGTGYSLQINSRGVMDIQDNTAQFAGKIKKGANLDLNAKLFLPSGAGVAVEARASLKTNGNSSDLLRIGGNNIVIGNGRCDEVDDPDTDPPYCGGGSIIGPIGFDENVINTEGGLPIKLRNFMSILSDNTVRLKWQTISEENVDYFSIERSEDGDIFYEIGTVQGHGNSNDPIDYSFVDENPLFGTSFYRLNAIDYDGTYEKFQTLSVEFIPDDLQVSIYPNPGNSDNMTLRLGSPSEAKLKTISIIYT